jgi:hypothetical protein
MNDISVYNEVDDDVLNNEPRERANVKIVIQEYERDKDLYNRPPPKP